MTGSVSLPGESPEYREARDRLLAAEIELRRATEAVASRRRELPPGGVVPHVTQRVSLAVVGRSDPARIEAFARERGWRHVRLVSSAHNNYNRDYLGELPSGSQMPMLNVFTKRDGEVRHHWGSELLYAPGDEGQDNRHVDFIWPLWNVLDATPEGRGTDWNPALQYG